MFKNSQNKAITTIIIVEVILVVTIISLYKGLAQNLDWKQIIPAIIGAIIGAMASAIPSYLQFKRTLQSAYLRDEADRLNNTKIKIFKGVVKLNLITSDIFGYYLTIERQSLLEEFGPELWKKVPAIAGLTVEKIHFESDELVVFAEKYPILVDKLLVLSRRHFGTLTDLAKYNELRQEYANKNPFISIDDKIFTADLAHEDSRKVLPLKTSLSSLIDLIWNNLQEDKDFSMEVIDAFNIAVREILNDSNYKGVKGFTKPNSK